MRGLIISLFVLFAGCIPSLEEACGPGDPCERGQCRLGVCVSLDDEADAAPEADGSVAEDATPEDAEVVIADVGPPDDVGLPPDAGPPDDVGLPSDAEVLDAEVLDAAPPVDAEVVDAEVVDAEVVDSDGDGDPDFSDCDDENPNIHHGADEICNNVDDNCDGSVDEGISGCCDEGDVRDCESSGVGLCSDLEQACQNAMWGACEGAVLPVVEVCNGRDDDCDGETDEDFEGLGDDCSVGQGICERSGEFVCDGEASVICEAVAGQIEEEVCDGIDNDCDGTPDDGGADLCVESAMNQHAEACLGDAGCSYTCDADWFDFDEALGCERGCPTPGALSRFDGPPAEPPTEVVVGYSPQGGWAVASVVAGLIVVEFNEHHYVGARIAGTNWSDLSVVVDGLHVYVAGRYATQGVFVGVGFMHVNGHTDSVEMEYIEQIVPGVPAVYLRGEHDGGLTPRVIVTAEVIVNADPPIGSALSGRGLFDCPMGIEEEQACRRLGGESDWAGENTGVAVVVSPTGLSIIGQVIDEQALGQGEAVGLRYVFTANEWDGNIQVHNVPFLAQDNAVYPGRISAVRTDGWIVSGMARPGEKVRLDRFNTINQTSENPQFIVNNASISPVVVKTGRGVVALHRVGVELRLELLSNIGMRLNRHVVRAGICDAVDAAYGDGDFRVACVSGNGQSGHQDTYCR